VPGRIVDRSSHYSFLIFDICLYLIVVLVLVSIFAIFMSDNLPFDRPIVALKNEYCLGDIYFDHCSEFPYTDSWVLFSP